MRGGTILKISAKINYQMISTLCRNSHLCTIITKFQALLLLRYANDCEYAGKSGSIDFQDVSQLILQLFDLCSWIGFLAQGLGISGNGVLEHIGNVRDWPGGTA